MNKGIIRSSENIEEISDFLLVEWSVIYNSKTYLEFELIFNSDLDYIFNDYNFINSTSGFNGLKIYIREASNLLATEIPFSKNGSTYSSTSIPGNDVASYTINPYNNSIKFNYFPTTFLTENNVYTVIIRLHENILNFEREIILNDIISNVRYIESGGQETFQIAELVIPTPTDTILTVDSSTPIKLTGYYIKSDDSVKLTIKNQTIGVNSGINPSTINNISFEHPYDTTPHYGTIYDSTANFSFSITPLAQQSNFTIDQTKKLKLHVVKTSQSFDVNYTHLTCHSDILIDSTQLSEIQTTSGTYTIFIPVMKDVNDSINVVFKDQNNISGKLSSNGSNFNATVASSPVAMTNGQFTFSVNYDKVPLATNGSAWGVIQISNVASDVILTKSLDYVVQQNIPPTIDTFTISPPNVLGNYVAGDSITLTATASDVDGSISTVYFYNNLIQIGTDSSSAYTHTLPNPTADTYSFTSTAEDDDGQMSSSSAAINITVVNNTAPTVSITNPVNSANIIIGTVVSFDATATDTIDGIQMVQFYYNDGTNPDVQVGSNDTTSPYSVSWNTTGFIAGTYTLKAKATDNHGLNTTDTITVTLSV